MHQNTSFVKVEFGNLKHSKTTCQNKNIYGYSAANLGKASHQQPYPQHVANLITIRGQRPRTFRNTLRNENAASANARRRALGVGGRRRKTRNRK